jgi:hypothetical protein
LVWRVRACAVKLQVLEAGASPQGRLMQLPRGNSSASSFEIHQMYSTSPASAVVKTLQKNRPCQGDAKTPYIDSRFSRTEIGVGCAMQKALRTEIGVGCAMQKALRTEIGVGCAMQKALRTGSACIALQVQLRKHCRKIVRARAMRRLHI